MAFATSEFRRALMNWYRRHGRDLPWRYTRDPYAILVSEFMLQQTQVATVRSYYSKWLQRFPSFATLARASETDVLHAWQGLGYYARARNLHATAKLVQNRHRGQFPREIPAMRELPGVGKYTAHAVATFAFDQPVPIIEANTARLFARLCNLRLPVESAAARQFLWQHAAELVPKCDSAAFNSALVDLGALVCLPRMPKCGICPVQKFCRAVAPEFLPVRRPRRKIRRLLENHAFVLDQNQVLLEQAHRRWRGMWILPPLTLDCFKQSSWRRYLIHESFFPFTHHRVTLRVFRTDHRKIDNRKQRWFAIDDLKSIPIPSPHRRAITCLLTSPS